MSAPRGKKAQTDAERYDQRQKRGIAAGAAKRSQNTRARTIDEVRATLHDAYVQLGQYAKKNGRPDFVALAAVVGTVRGAMSMQPWTRSELAEKLHGLEKFVFTTGWRPDGSKDPFEYRAPSMDVYLTHDGLQQVQQAVADRVNAGLLPAEAPAPPTPPTPTETIDFREASARLRARRAEDRRREP